MVKFLATQIRLGRLTFEQIADNPNTAKYVATVAAELEG